MASTKVIVAVRGEARASGLVTAAQLAVTRAYGRCENGSVKHVSTMSKLARTALNTLS